jgi:hypothetical protein
MSSAFGVKAETIEQAFLWVEAVTGIKAEPRESSQLGGNYYAFRGSSGEVLKLISNRDLYDREPVIDGCDDWSIVLLLDDVPATSALWNQLNTDSVHFQKL